MSSLLEKFGALTLGLKGLHHSLDADCDRLQRDIRSLDCQCTKQVSRDDIAACKQSADNLASRQRRINEYILVIKNSYGEIGALANAAARDADRLGVSAITNVAEAVLSLIPVVQEVIWIERILRALGALAKAALDVSDIDDRIKRDMVKIRSLKRFIQNRANDIKSEEKEMDKLHELRRDLGCSDNADIIHTRLNEANR